MAATWVPAVIGATVGGTIGFIASLAAEGVQRWIYGPRLSLDYSESPNHRIRTDVGDPKRAEAIYMRMRVRNTKPRIAKSCRAFLTKVEHRRPDGSWAATIYGDSIQLAWSAQPVTGFVPMEIPRGVDQFIDVVSVYNPIPNPPPDAPPLPRDLNPNLTIQPFAYRDIWTYHGTYRLTVLVSGDGVLPVSRMLILSWNGIWDQISASDGGPA